MQRTAFTRYRRHSCARLLLQRPLLQSMQLLPWGCLHCLTVSEQSPGNL